MTDSIGIQVLCLYEADCRLLRTIQGIYKESKVGVERVLCDVLVPV